MRREKVKAERKVRVRKNGECFNEDICYRLIASQMWIELITCRPETRQRDTQKVSKALPLKQKIGFMLRESKHQIELIIKSLHQRRLLRE